MESDKLYRIIFYVGAGWNFAIAAALLVMTSSLPTLLNIEPPRYPLFIHLNLMSIFFFGCMQWVIARNLHGHRSFVKVLMWAKLAMSVVFVYSIVVDKPPMELVSFLAPGMVVDVIFGLIFWRFLVYERAMSH